MSADLSSIIEKRRGGDRFDHIAHEANIAIDFSYTIGTQYEINSNKLKVSAGLRFDHYNVEDKENSGSDKSGNVVSPRLTFKSDIKKYLQARVGYAQGYRAPQIFDEDLHIETSGSRKVIHENSPDLEQEKGHNYMASLDFNKQPAKVYMGLNIENNIVPSADFSRRCGFTIQSSEYEEEQEFDEKRFFRTPQDYGYITLDWSVTKSFAVLSTGNYTGKMLVPYFGYQIPEPEEGELRESDNFLM